MVISAEQMADEGNLRGCLLLPQTVELIENELLIRIVDIPEIHCFQEDTGDRFFDSLSKV